MRVALLHVAADWVEVRPLEYLGAGDFALFRQVHKCFGSVTRKLTGEGGTRWETAVPRFRVRDLAADLERYGFAVEPDAGVSEILRKLELAESAERGRSDRSLDGLYPFQRAGALWLRDKRRALLSDSMGLGKTRQALAAHGDGPLLVVSPASVKGVWIDEAARVRSDLRSEVLSGRGSFRWPEPGQVLATSYEILPPSGGERSRAKDLVRGIRALCGLPTVWEDDDSSFPAVPPGTTLVADEAHALANQSLRTRRFRSLAQAVLDAGGQVWLLTGTPILNDPLELWSVLECADLGYRSFGSFEEFARAFGGKKLPHGGWYWRGPTDAVGAALADAVLRRTREEVLPELPAKTREVLRTDELPRVEAAFVRDVEARIEAAGLWEHPELLPMFEGFSRARELLAASKIAVLLYLCQSHAEAGEPLVVFSAHRAPIDALAMRDGWEVITGSTSVKSRGEIVRAFQAGELEGIGGTIGAMGTGITLTRSCRVVFVDRDFTPARNEQAEDRTMRIGQTRGVIVTDLVAPHALDVRVHQILTAKSALVEGTLGRISHQPSAISQSRNRIRSG